MNELENLPKTITPCPIIETSVEIRCDFNIPPDAIIGVIFNEFRAECQFINLPNNNIPPEIRAVNPNFKYQPTHRFIYNQNNNLIIDIGSNVIRLIYTLKYDGWNVFKPFIDNSLKKIFGLSIITQISFLSLKYLDFFPEANIFKNINLKIFLNNNTMGDEFTVFNTEIKDGEFVKVLQIANNAHVKNSLFDKDGSILDLTIVKNGLIKVNNEYILQLINSLHFKQKTTFFSLLKPEFLDSLNPKY